jgi:hypothetical protein
VHFFNDMFVSLLHSLHSLHAVCSPGLSLLSFSLFQVISEHCKTRGETKPFSHFVMDLYREVLGTFPQASNVNTEWSVHLFTIVLCLGSLHILTLVGHNRWQCHYCIFVF